MDKESEVSSTAIIHQGRRRKEPQTALILPNPYKSQPSSKGNQSGLSSTQRSGLHRYSHHVRENGNNNRSKNVKEKKTSKGDIGTPAHMGMDSQKRGKGLPDFEVKMDDFPELTGIFVSQAYPTVAEKKSWGPPASLKENSASAWKLNRKGSSTDFGPEKINLKSDTPDITLGDPSAAQDSSPGSVTSSWASIASQPPKKSIPKETLNSGEVDEVALQEEEATIGKKKRKKKKKKAKTTDEVAEPGFEKKKFNQEPPKFEDEDEFPGLGPAFTVVDKLIIKSNAANLCNDENQRQSIQHQSADQKKEKSAKSPSTESMKKAQKAEKVSGKKSKVPVQLDIGNMLAVLEKKQAQKTKQDTKPLTLSVGGGLPVVPKQQPVQKKPWLQEKIAHNPLDSTSPLVKKGKQREVPKAKKPTALKKVILKEREERKQKRLLEERGLHPENESKLAEEAHSLVFYTVPQPSDEMLSSTDEPDQPEICGTANEEGEEDEEAAQTASLITTPVTESKIHSRKFRDYCSQMLSKDVDECVTALLKELVRFQDRLYQKDPMKARIKRRIVMGLREVLKHLKLRKVKCVIISPNCERIQSKGGLDEALHAIIDACREQGVPFVFALSRKALGRSVNKAVPVSLVGIFNFDGAQDIYHKMIELSSEARKAYEEMLLSLEQTPQSESEPPADTEQAIEADQMHIVSDTAQPEEPEYIKLWKKLLEKESSHNFVSFEEHLSSMHLNSECTEDRSNEDGMS